MRLLSWDRLHTILLANGYPDVIRKQPEFVNIGVPQQPKMSHACGIFTILYVCAIMLRIPLRDNPGTSKKDLE